MQQFVVISSLEFGHEQNEIATEFKFVGKDISEMIPKEHDPKQTQNMTQTLPKTEFTVPMRM